MRNPLEGIPQHQKFNLDGGGHQKHNLEGGLYKHNLEGGSIHQRPSDAGLVHKQNFGPDRNYQMKGSQKDEDVEKKKYPDQFSNYQTPPQVVIANRRNGEDDPEVETLQMIHAKQSDRKDSPFKGAVTFLEL